MDNEELVLNVSTEGEEAKLRSDTILIISQGDG